MCFSKLSLDVPFQSSAQRESQLCEELFIKLIRFIKQLQDKVTALMEESERAVVSQAEKLIKQLEQELNELSKRNEDLEQLAETEDQIHFLQVSIPQQALILIRGCVSAVLSTPTNQCFLTAQKDMRKQTTII